MDEITVGADFEAMHLVDVFDERRRQMNDGNAGGLFIRANTAANFEPVDVRKIDIEDYQIDVVLDLGQCFRSRPGLEDGPTDTAENMGRRVPSWRVVVDHQDANRITGHRQYSSRIVAVVNDRRRGKRRKNVWVL